MRNRIILPPMGLTPHFCDRVRSDNEGDIMDLGHALIVQENPAAERAASSAMAKEAERDRAEQSARRLKAAIR